MLPVKLTASIKARLADGEVVSADIDPSFARLTLPLRMRVRGGRTWIARTTDAPARVDASLIKALRAAHALVDHGRDGEPVLRVAPAKAYDRKIVRLAFLAPQIQRAILEGRQPLGLSVDRLIADAPALLWSEQITAF